MVGLVGLFVVLPASIAIVRSFFDWQPGSESPFVGLDNYREVVGAPVFREIVVNELIFMIGVPLWAGVPLLVTFLLYEGVPFAGVLRTIFMLPTALSPVVMGILFGALLRPDGILNTTLESLGLGFLERQWVDDPDLVKPVIIIVVIWFAMGFGVLLYSAALSAVPPELFEAAEVDGAGWIQRLLYIMIPAIFPVFVLNLVFNIATVFLLFGYVFVLSRGGPGYASTTLDWDIYEKAFDRGEFGLAAAESALLLVAMFVILLVTVRVARRFF
jgi:multiple sugar transport system permease protein